MKKAILLFSMVLYAFVGAHADDVSGYYTKITTLSELDSGGYYVFYGINSTYEGAMANTISSGKLSNESVSIVSDVISNPSSTIVWKVNGNATDGYTVYNDAVDLYCEITSDQTSAFELNADTSHTYTVTVSDEAFSFMSNDTSTHGRSISIYQSDWRAYKSPKPIYLYKRTSLPSITIDNVLPLAESTFDLGEVIDISATVVTDDIDGIDSVVWLYGTAVDALLDTITCLADADVFATTYTFADVSTLYGQFLAYGHNGETRSSTIVSLYGVCPVVAPPVAIAASDIESTSFVANWNQVDDASTYQLCVWTETEFEDTTQLTINGGFEAGSDAWSTFDDEYEIVDANVTQPHSGDSCLKCFPSATRSVAQDINFTADGLSTYTISYWYKYNTDTTAKKLRIWSTLVPEQLSGDDLTQSGYNDVVTDWTQHTYQVTPAAGENTLHLELKTYNGGEAFIDDISFTKDGTSILQDTVLLADALATTSYDLTNLTHDTNFNYSVKAINAYGCMSESSNAITLNTELATFLDFPQLLLQAYGISQAIVIHTSGKQTVTVYDISGRLVTAQQVSTHATLQVNPGLYLVRVGNDVTRVVVR